MSDPYAVWVSEVMLQQTRVAAVTPYYGRFLRRFPDVSALARARLETVLSLWSGLGYYRRARMLHAAARRVAREGFPGTAAGWRRLPGVGEYTAAAVASIAFGEPVAVVDGNVERVLCRLHAEPRPGRRAILSNRAPLARNACFPARCSCRYIASFDLALTAPARAAYNAKLAGVSYPERKGTEPS